MPPKKFTAASKKKAAAAAAAQDPAPAPALEAVPAPAPPPAAAQPEPTPAEPSTDFIQVTGGHKSNPSLIINGWFDPVLDDRVNKRDRDDSDDEPVTIRAPAGVSGGTIISVDELRGPRPEPESDSDDDPSLDIVKYTPNQIRTKIRALINSGEMKIGQFQNAIGVTSRSYLDFMRSSGRKGEFSNTYSFAHRFFVKRERKGIKIPRANAKRAKVDGAGDKGEGKGKGKGATKDAKTVEKEADVSDITLEGEDTLSVPVFDTCDDVRNKINAQLRKPGVTMAGFGRTIAETYKRAGQEDKAIQGKQIRDFLEKKGARAGATSSVFYSSYVYFEKLRIKNGKDKNAKRIEMERRHGRRGMETDFDSSRRVIVGANQIPYEDSYGTLHVQRMY